MINLTYELTVQTGSNNTDRIGRQFDRQKRQTKTHMQLATDPMDRRSDTTSHHEQQSLHPSVQHRRSVGTTRQSVHHGTAGDQSVPHDNRRSVCTTRQQAISRYHTTTSDQSVPHDRLCEAPARLSATLLQTLTQSPAIPQVTGA